MNDWLERPADRLYPNDRFKLAQASHKCLNKTMTRKTRVLKKIHRYWLNDVVCDLSPHSNWRKKIIDSNFDEKFAIDSQNSEGLAPPTLDALRKYHLEFTVCKVHPSKAEPLWLASGDSVIFEFRSVLFPSVVQYSGNNPDTI